MIKTKMRLENVIPIVHGGAKVIFRYEYDPRLVAEELSFSSDKTDGVAEFIMNNPKAAGQLIIGGTYFFEITKT